ncbi:class I SAM-dependent methyltransferase [Nocardia wallacei]|uniref:class I SAM-dependent methyltransferase n=1 Tax=Nocardia wallacei TaxID=480035 RepID=UPI0024584C36|nr:class I SAM-dependent methyltransferase [Nocardia wallacei]
MDAQFWDERYGSRDLLFSGEPNAVLVTEVAGLPPGQALDVGCGEGGDARWLAGRGWQVTAVDISRVALERAEAVGVPGPGAVAWTRADLTATAMPAAAFDLVSVQYFPFPRQPGPRALRGLIDAVAPGGILLFVGHDPADLTGHEDIDPTAFYHPTDIPALLDSGWVVETSETRLRTGPPPAGTHHTHDVVLRARRGR